MRFYISPGGDGATIWKVVLTVSVIVLLVAQIIVNYAVAADFPSKEEASQLQETDWWLMFQHDPNHSGYSTSRVPIKNETLWVTNIGTTASVGFAPSVADGRVFVGSTRYFWCINSSSGLILWNYSKSLDPSTSPAISNGRVIISGGQEELFCLNTTNGNFLWKFTAGSYIRSSPIIKDGRVFVGSWGNGLYCMNETNGKLLWNIGTSSVVTSPAVAGDRVFVQIDVGLVCLNATSGDQLWASPLANSGHSSPTFYKGKVLIGTSYANNTLYCFNSSSGDIIWKYQTEGWIEATPAVVNDKVFLGDRGNTAVVYCLNAQDGSLFWKHSYEGEFGAEYSSPAIADGKIVLCLGRKLFVLNEFNGEVIWNYNPPIIGYDINRSPGFTGSSVALAEGRIYVASEEGSLYCFGPMLYYMITIDPEFCDNRGESFTPLPSTCTFLFSNGTEKNTTIPVNFSAPMGSFSIVNVLWRDTEVLKQKVTMFLDSNTIWVPKVRCLLPTDLTMNISSGISLIGYKVEITGNVALNGLGLFDIPLVLHYSVTKGVTWNEITQVFTSSEGDYSVIWMPSATGNFMVKTSWVGNSTYPEATQTVNLVVIPFEGSVFSVTSNSTTSGLTFNSTIRELSFTVSGPSGTRGYAATYVAKSLISDIAEVRVYLNGTQSEYIANIQDDAWEILLVYSHSTHKVVVKLGPLTGVMFPPMESLLFILLSIAVILIVGSIMVKRKRDRTQQ